MAKREKTNMITRRVIESRTYEVYEVVNGEFKLLGTETLSGRVNDAKLAEQYSVEKVVTVEIAVNKKVYGVPVEDFMAIAVDITADEETTQTENKGE